MSPLSFDNKWTDCNVDCCINTVDKKLLRYKFGLVNFGPVTPEILYLIWVCGEST